MEETTWRIPDGHEHVSAGVSQAHAETIAREHVARNGGAWAYYLTDKRGAWEVIRYRKVPA